MKRLALALVLLLAACSEKKPEGWLGYGEGDNAMISAPQAGWVTGLMAERGKTVKRGDLLFVLDNVQQQASQEQSQATLEQMRAARAVFEKLLEAAPDTGT
jgi:multidrug resistance efflux pump